MHYTWGHWAGGLEGDLEELERLQLLSCRAYTLSNREPTEGAEQGVPIGPVSCWNSKGQGTPRKLGLTFTVSLRAYRVGIASEFDAHGDMRLAIPCPFPLPAQVSAGRPPLGAHLGEKIVHLVGPRCRGLTARQCSIFSSKNILSIVKQNRLGILSPKVIYLGKKKGLHSGRRRHGEPFARTEQDKDEVLYREKLRRGAGRPGLLGQASDVTLELFP